MRRFLATLTQARLAASAAVAACGVATIVAAATAAGPWPTHPVRIVVPSAAGGSSDGAARLVTAHFQAVFREPFIVENRPGNGGAMGAGFAAQAEPDGYTLLIANSASNLTVPLVVKNAGYDPVADFTHIVMLERSPYVFAVHPRLGAKTLAEFIAKAKVTPVSYTAANRGSLSFIGGEYFQRLAHFTMQHVPYRGGGPAAADAIAGHVPVIFSPMTTLGPHLRSGALVALAVTSETRTAVLPDVPTFAELGYPELTMWSWFGLSGPRGIPPDIVDRLNRETRVVLKEPQMRKLAEQDAAEPLDLDAADFTRYVAGEVARWGAVAKMLDIKLDD
jgi:tripartite-type tricarboxylate transporter receptor subunit TctC